MGSISSGRTEGKGEDSSLGGGRGVNRGRGEAVSLGGRGGISFTGGASDDL